MNDRWIELDGVRFRYRIGGAHTQPALLLLHRLGGDAVDRLPHLVCLGIEGIEPQPVLLGLDALGVAVHSGSSCSSEALEPSPVLAAMGVDAERSLRVSVGWTSTEDEVRRFLGALASVLAYLRALRRG